jgi:hypothetical protein
MIPEEFKIPATKLSRCSIPRATILKKMEKISLMKSARSSPISKSELEPDSDMDELRKSFFDILNSQIAEKSARDTHFMAHSNLGFLKKCSKICLKKG